MSGANGPSSHRPTEGPAFGVTPARGAVKPVLLDAQVVAADGSRGSVFLTPLSAMIERHQSLITAGASGVFLLAAAIAAQVDADPSLRNLVVLCAFSIAAVPAMASVWESLSQFRIDIDALMLLGACLAAVIGSPLEGALLLFLFALSGALEEFALDRTQAAIVSLHNLMPTEALVIKNGVTERVSLKRVAIGDRVLVRPGDRVPLDGTVVEGGSSVDESAITGESVPRDKAVGHAVFAGTANLQGRLVVEANKAATDSALARILELVTEARHQRAGVQRLIDRIGPTYSVLVVVASVLSGLVMRFLIGLPGDVAAYRAIALLIVCSPCALVIATPVAYLSGIAAAARRGIMIKGGVYLETLAAAKAIVFDKTGTLTTGNVRLSEVIPCDGIDASEALRYAGALESSSSHPLAGAVMQSLSQRELSPFDVEDLKSVPGVGIAGKVNGRQVWIGRASTPQNDRRDDGFSIAESYRKRFQESVQHVYESGRAASALIVDGIPVVLAFEDTVRDDAREVVDSLRANGIARVDMLTGDHQVVARQIARRLNIDDFRADLLPEDKLSAARSLREKHGAIVMVGDGVNDAPALADADVGIAIGSIGADVALEAADIVLMNERLDGITWLHSHARRTSRIVRQNLSLAIGVIVVLSGFALSGHIPLPLAVVGHEGSTVLVALNALRLLRG